MKLTKDLSKYDARCTVGVLGWTDPKTDGKGKITVHYDSGAVLDTYWSSLEKVQGEVIPAPAPQAMTSQCPCPGPCPGPCPNPNPDNGGRRRPWRNR